MKLVAAIVAALSLTLSPPHPTHHHRHDPCGKHATAWVCAKRLSKSWYGWKGQEWVAENAIVRRESGWDSCAHWPSVHHDCAYDGTVLCAATSSGRVCSNACGIPQATPCPTAWRGHLDKWRRQVFWFLHYIHDRWGDPINAYYHETHGGY